MANNPFQQSIASKRQEVNPWEIRKNSDYEKLDVVSRATDPYVQIARQATSSNMAAASSNPDADAIKDIVSNVNSTVKSYVTIQEQSKEENKIKGTAEAIKNNDIKAKAKEKPSEFFNLGLGYNEAYEEMQGKLDSANYKNEANKFILDNGHLPPDQFNALMKEKLTAPFLQREGLTPHQLAGLIPEVMATDKMASSHNAKRWADSQEIEKNALIGKNVDITIEGNLQTAWGLNSIEQLNDPTWKNNWFAMDNSQQGIVQKQQMTLQLSQNMHQTYLLEQAKAEAVGKTKAEFADTYLRKASANAVLYGNPALLDFTRMKDKDGVAIADKFPDQVKIAYREAYAAENHLKEAFKAQQIAEQKEMQRTALNESSAALFDIAYSKAPDRAAKAWQVWSQFRKDADDLKIGTEQFNHMQAVVDKIGKLGDFANTSDSPTMKELWGKGASLNVSEVMAAARKLEEKDWLNLMHFAEGNLRKGQDKDLDLRRMALTDKMDAIVGMYAITGVDGIVTPENQIKAKQIKGELASFIGQNYKSADAKGIEKHWQENLLKTYPIPTKVIDSAARQTQAAQPTNKGMQRKEYAPIGKKFTVDGKIMTSDGKGGWH